MATIDIAGTKFQTRRPTDLDDQLIASTGCSSAEIDKLLEGGPDRVARALLPFVTADTVSVGELAGMIATDRAAADQIRALYVSARVTEEKKDRADG